MNQQRPYRRVGEREKKELAYVLVYTAHQGWRKMAIVDVCPIHVSFALGHYIVWLFLVEYRTLLFLRDLRPWWPSTSLELL